MGSSQVGGPTPKHRRAVWAWVGVSCLILVVALVIVGEMVIHRAGPILKEYVTDTLSAHFHGRVELGSLDVSVLRGLEVSGARLAIYPPNGLAAAGSAQPLFAIENFSFHSGISGLFLKPMHVGTVHVTGFEIKIPPRETRQQAPETAVSKSEIKIVVDEIVCDQSRLIIGTTKPDKDPKDFELRHIEMRNVGPDAPLKYDATLTNPTPRGDIHATGSFGPWQAYSPGESAVTGHYTFDRADLNTIKGIGGILSSVGDFQGQLDRIIVDGTTETPDFSLDTANHGMPLHTQFHAIVDGISGDTYLEPVYAKLRNSAFTAAGAVVNIKGHGHRIDLNVDVSNATLQDFLELVIKTEPAIMSGVISTKTKLQILPGRESVSQRMKLAGGVTLGRIRFSNPAVQDKVDMLSLRAQGRPKEAKPGAKDVSSRMTGKFEMDKGLLEFTDLVYILPGARVNLEGIYSLDGEQFDFHGKVRTEASLSQMVASPWASLLLKAISPFFKKNGAGAEIPVSLSGTKSAPKFGLEVLR